MARGYKVAHNGFVFRSKFEYRIALALEKQGTDYGYEEEQYEYFTKVRNGVCEDCSGTHVVQRRWYTPDFFLPNGLIIEAKGQFTSSNRVTLKAVRDAHDSLDLRLVFMANNRISKNSTTTYIDWAEQFNFKWALKEIPESWLKPCKHRLGLDLVCLDCGKTEEAIDDNGY